jgi:FkbM family methyltransferase
MNIVSDYKYGKVIYNTNDYYMGNCISEYGEYCDEEINLLSTLVKKDDTILDIGANIGLMTIPFSKMVGSNGKVFSFEPQSKIYYILCSNIVINNLNNVESHNIAIGDSNQPLFLPNIDYNKSNNFGGISLSNMGEIKIQQIKLDDISFEKLNLLKIDVEGMEINVLNGAKETLNKHRPILYIENDRPNQSENLLNFLFSNGYDCYWHVSNLFNLNNHKKNIINVFDKNYICINVLAIPKEKELLIDLNKIKTPQDWLF